MCGGLAVAATPARALEWGVLGGLDVAHDDNLFRQAIGTPDTSYSIGSGVVLDAPGRAMNGRVEADVRRTWFARNSGLDNTGYSLSAEASRSGPLQLDVSADRDRRLSDFGDVRVSVRNIQTLTTIDGQARLAVTGDFRAVAGGSLVRSVNSAAQVAFSDYQTSGFTAGAGYYPSTGNSIALLFSRLDSHGLRSRPVDLGRSGLLQYRQKYTQDDVSVRLHVAPSVLTSADVHVARVDRHDESVLHKNLNGFIGDVTFVWKPLRTLDITARAGRQLQTDSYIYSDAVRDNFASLDVQSRVTRTLTARLGYSFDRQRFVYDVQAPVPLQPRLDRRQTVRASLSRALTPFLDLEAEGHHEMRRSSDSRFRYADTGAFLTLSAHFGAATTRRRR